MDNFDASQLKTLCRGNAADRSWTQDSNGNWVPSIHDRRRVAVSYLDLLAEQTPSGVIQPPIVLHVLKVHSTDANDQALLVQNFQAWNSKNH